jgi:hypothetical protein
MKSPFRGTPGNSPPGFVHVCGKRRVVRQTGGGTSPPEAPKSDCGPGRHAAGPSASPALLALVHACAALALADQRGLKGVSAV